MNSLKTLKYKGVNMEDFTSTNEEEIREQHLKSEALLMMEEAHYVHTINAFVELIVLYGWDKVISDLRTAMGEKEW
jgi:hypothetical protein